MRASTLFLAMTVALAGLQLGADAKFSCKKLSCAFDNKPCLSGVHGTIDNKLMLYSDNCEADMKKLWNEAGITDMGKWTCRQSSGSSDGGFFYEENDALKTDGSCLPPDVLSLLADQGGNMKGTSCNRYYDAGKVKNTGHIVALPPFEREKVDLTSSCSSGVLNAFNAVLELKEEAKKEAGDKTTGSDTDTKTDEKKTDTDSKTDETKTDTDSKTDDKKTDTDSKTDDKKTDTDSKTDAGSSNDNNAAGDSTTTTEASFSATIAAANGLALFATIVTTFVINL